MKKLLLATAVAAASFTAPSFAEIEGLSATGGFVSDYVFRGSYLGDASMYASVDYENSGFYAGIWGISYDSTTTPTASLNTATNTLTVNPGDQSNAADDIEYDIYFGYGMDVNEDLSLSLGYTQYNYENDRAFQQEINLSAGFKMYGLNVDLGQNDPNTTGSQTNDYMHVAASASGETYGFTLGSVTTEDAANGPDTDTIYYEVSASAELFEGLSSTFLIGASETETGSAESDDTYFVLDLSKGFEF